MNENERTPAETAADYAVHFADGFFVPCPCCGKEVKSPDNGFTSEKEAMEWALGACDCAGAKAWQQQRPALRMDSPCVAGKMKAGRCGHTAYTARCTGSACSAYHPELYAPDLYARAFDLYAKRKAKALLHRAVVCAIIKASFNNRWLLIIFGRPPWTL